MTSAESFPPNPSDVETPQRIRCLPRLVGDDVDRALRVGLAVMNRRRDRAARDGQREDRGLDRRPRRRGSGRSSTSARSPECRARGRRTRA